MNATETRAKLNNAKHRLEEMREWRAFLERKRQELLVEDDARARHDRAIVEHGAGVHDAGPYDLELQQRFSRGLPGLRVPGLRATTAEISLLEERVAALAAELPTAEDVTRARARFEELSEAARISGRRTREIWEAFVVQVEAIELLAQDLDVARRKTRTASFAATELTREYGLDRVAPSPHEPGELERQYVGLLASYVHASAVHQVIDDGVLLADLEAARARVRRPVVGAVTSVETPA